MNNPPVFQVTYTSLLICLECCETAVLPNYLGSALHGILGWALRPFPKTYQYLFENRRYSSGQFDIVNPYVIDPPRTKTVYHKGEILLFRLLLIGKAVSCVQDVIQALAGSGTFGLGAQRKLFKLNAILHGESLSPVWNADIYEASVPKVTLSGDELLVNSTHCSVQLITPLRIRRSGELLTKLDFPTVIRNVTRRIAALTERYGGSINAEEAKKICLLSEQVKQTSAGLYVSKIERYSSRKNAKMEFNGLCGAVTYEGDITPFTPWLNAARILHIGRNVTLGYGSIEVIFH